MIRLIVETGWRQSLVFLRVDIEVYIGVGHGNWQPYVLLSYLFALIYIVVEP